MAEWRSSNAMPADPFQREINSSWGLTAGHLLALIDAVEAAQRVEQADSNGGYISTVPSEATTALEELETALARFQP